MHLMTVFLLLACALACTLAAPSPFRANVNQPAPPSRDNQRHGTINGGVQRDKGVGTSVHVNGQGDVWRSRDGNSRVHANGHYGQVVHGPAKGAKGYGGAINFEHKF